MSHINTIESQIKEQCDKQALQGVTKYCPSKLPNAGNGVVITRRAPKGAVLAYYDGYLKAESLITKQEGRYAIGHSEDAALVGYICPRKSHPGGLAQYVNDAARPIVAGPSIGIAALCRSMADYMLESQGGCNVEILTGSSVMVARRDVRAGEELYLHYGERYWLDDLRFRHDDEGVRRVANTLLTLWLKVIEPAHPALYDNIETRARMMQALAAQVEQLSARKSPHVATAP